VLIIGEEQDQELPITSGRELTPFGAGIGLELLSTGTSITLSIVSVCPLN
jgi:hypothetical protein